MSALSFDTHKFIRRLKDSGLPENQAEALAEAFRDAVGEFELVTRKDLQIELAPMRADLVLIKWMIGIVLAGVGSLVLKAFF